MTIDLCILRQGVWELHSTFSPSDADGAVQDGIRYKQEKAYSGVAVIDEESKRVLYGFAPGGKTPSFTEVVRSLKEGKRNLRQEGMQIAAKARAKNTNSKGVKTSAPPIQTNSKLNSWVSNMMLSLIVAVAIFMFLLNTFDDVASAFFGSTLTAGLALLVFRMVHFDPSSAIEVVAKSIALKMQAGALNITPTEPSSPDTSSIEKHLKKIIESAATVLEKDGAEAHHETALGIILLCSGAVEHLHQTQEHRRSVLIDMASDLIQNSSFAIPKASIIACYKNVLEYLAYPRYASMYDVGYQISKTFQAHKNEGELTERILQAFKLWDQQQASTPDDHTAAAILFSDIVSFTSTHQERGDTWMMRVLNTHNDALREGIQITGGREIKHTGDGIMASFNSVKDALDAAVIAQKHIHTFNQNNAQDAFQVRIAVSYGEPVHIGGDLFGTPVNKAARVLANTNGGEITLSSEAFTEVASLGLSATEKSGIEMKGFDGTHSIYSIDWQQEEPA